MAERDFRIIREAAELWWPTSVVYEIWHELETPYEPDPRLAELTPGQRAMYALMWTRSEVDNGGFHQLFFNSTGYLFPEAVEGAALLGGAELSAIFGDAASVLPDPWLRDKQARRRHLNLLTEDEVELLRACSERFFALNESSAGDLNSLYEAYIEMHPQEFFLDVDDDETIARALLTTARRVVNEGSSHLDLAERFLRDAIERATRAGDDRTADSAQSLLDQIPSLRI